MQRMLKKKKTFDKCIWFNGEEMVPGKRKQCKNKYSWVFFLQERKEIKMGIFKSAQTASHIQSYLYKSQFEHQVAALVTHL